MCYGSIVFFLGWSIAVGIFTGSCYYIGAFFDDLKIQVENIDKIPTKGDKLNKYYQLHGVENVVVLHNEIFM